MPASRRFRSAPEATDPTPQRSGSRHAVERRAALPLPRFPVCLALIALLACARPVRARQDGPPPSWSGEAAPLGSVELLSLDPGLRQAVGEPGRPGPLRFADVIPVSVSPATHGTWESLPDGSRLWRLRVGSPGATNLSFGFTRAWIPPGATLHVVSLAVPVYEGPFTAGDNRAHGVLFTPLVDGDAASIELRLPPGAAEPLLELTRVHHGFLTFPADPAPPDLSCIRDVACPEARPWDDEIRSVARLVINGNGLCTGTLVRSAGPDPADLLLTASHCEITPDVAATVVLYWNYQKTTCGGPANGDETQTTTGLVFRAREVPTDVAIYQLAVAPEARFNVYYAGWSRSDVPAPGAVGIHHPDGQEKRITFNTDPLESGPSCIGDSPDGTHWYLNWEDGSTLPGSSGSGLWDSESRRIVGVLSGGSSFCGNHEVDCYGKVAAAWDGPSADARLRDWLDPHGTNVVGIDGSNPGDPGGPPTWCPQADQSLRVADVVVLINVRRATLRVQCPAAGG